MTDYDKILSSEWDYSEVNWSGCEGSGFVVECDGEVVAECLCLDHDASEAVAKHIVDAHNTRARGEIMTEPIIIAAGELCWKHVGLETYLPGRLGRSGKGIKWVNTWAKITMIAFTSKGLVKIRRYPDGHVDHSLKPTDLITLRKAVRRD
jgi:hypothetical protein